MRSPTLFLSRISVLALSIATLAACGGGGGGGGSGSDAPAAPTQSNQGSLAVAEADSDHDGLIEISTLQQLDWIRNDLAGKSLTDADKRVNSKGCPASGCFGYELVADLNFDTNGDGVMDSRDTYFDYDKDGSNAGWRPIPQITATIEGNGRRISNLFINRPSTDYVGLFSSAVSSGSQPIKIRNLEVGGPLTSVTGRNGVGTLVGLLTVGGESTVENIIQSGRVSGVALVGGLAGSINLAGGSLTLDNNNVAPVIPSPSGSAGGLVGTLLLQQPGGTMSLTNNRANANLSAETAGGLVGSLSGGGATIVVDGNSSSGTVTSTRFDAGGLFGSISTALGGSLTIRNSQSNAVVSAQGDIPRSGGLIGNADSSGSLAIRNSHASGNVSSTVADAGGLLGRASTRGAGAHLDILYSYATGDVTTGDNQFAGGLVGTAFTEQGGTLSIGGSYGAGSVKGGTAGGLIGFARADSTGGNLIFLDNFSSGSVQATTASGGIVGQVTQFVGGTLDLSRNFAAGRQTVTGSAPFNVPGGIVGMLGINTGATYEFTNSLWAIDTNSAPNSIFSGPPGFTQSGVVGATRAQLECPLAANDTGCFPPNELFHNWHVSKDANGNALWNFGTTAQLPGLRFGSEIHRPVFDGSKYTVARETL